MLKYRLSFTIIILLFLSGIISLMIIGTTSLTQEELRSIRLDQLRQVKLDPDHNMDPIIRIGDIAVPDYFESTPAGYRYLGGVYGADWDVGSTYSLKELKSMNFPVEDNHPFIILRIGGDIIYINIDRGDDTAVRNFLKVMDRQQQSEIDTLIMDFRFLQTMDFGSVIRLFNQIAPPRQITFGTIINAYQEETIKSSGKPFFPAKRTLFLVDSNMPLPLKKLIQTLGMESSYQMVGDMGTIPDTVCLKAEYEIGPETYRICTAKLTEGDMGRDQYNPTIPISNSKIAEEMAEMDVLWYKSRDTVATKSQISRFLIPILYQ